jgi:hypothetical protein
MLGDQPPHAGQARGAARQVAGEGARLHVEGVDVMKRLATTSTVVARKPHNSNAVRRDETAGSLRRVADWPLGVRTPRATTGLQGSHSHRYHRRPGPV